jgi:signal transduction histidine kinase
MIAATAKDMEILVKDLLDAVRIEAGHLTLRRASQQPGEIVARVVEILKPLAVEKRILLELHADRGLPDISVDSIRIRQVFQNLIGNAIRFTPEDGRITVEISQQDDSVAFCVRDTGPGIAPDHLPHIFDRFWQAERDAPRASRLSPRSLWRS